MSQLELTPDHLVHPTRPASRRVARTILGLAAVGVLGLSACGNDDDGADVRSSGPGAEDCASASAPASGAAASGSEASASAASGSGCASASGSTSASGSGSASAAAAECQAIDGTAGVAGADTTVAATLDEFTIAVDPASAAAGAIGFVTENAGEEPHELVIARGVPADIEVVDGAPDEAALGDAVIGEIEAFPAGETCEGTYELAAGDYVLFCALVEEEEDGTVESHFEEGMVTTFAVS